MTVAKLLQLVDGAAGFAPVTAPAPLAELEAYFARFVAYPSEHARVAHTLWAAHAHLMDAWQSTPRIAFLSPEPASGKSRALEITETVVPNPVQAVNVTPAYLFRKIGEGDTLPTVLFDEADTVWGPRASTENEELRGLLNAGHRRGAVAGRCIVVGKTVRTEELPAFCAVALAGLGDLPDTILTRSVIVRMRRRAPHEAVEPFRPRLHEAEGHALRNRLAGWADSVRAAMAEALPTMPPGVCDRDADVWEPLLAVADAAGGDWPQRARVAAVALVAAAKAGTPSLGVRLLADLRTVFGDREVMSTVEILKDLCAIEESPWADLKGKALDARGLSNRLKAYGVSPTTVRIGEHTPKGYRKSDLFDTWQRYLGGPGIGVATSATNATAAE
ncbi:MAG: DUF3631 domain-containing protein [Rubrivivax sp.]|nr:DUF3631 domain-containing protein [Rubrivivax sp.]